MIFNLPFFFFFGAEFNIANILIIFETIHVNEIDL